MAGLTSYQRVRNYTRRLGSPFNGLSRYRLTPAQRRRYRRKLRRHLRHVRDGAS